MLCSGHFDISHGERRRVEWELPPSQRSAGHPGKGNNRQTDPDGAVQQGAQGQWSAAHRAEDSSFGFKALTQMLAHFSKKSKIDATFNLHLSLGLL